MLANMSGRGDCYENAVAESFFATLEFELVIYVSPAEYEAQLSKAALFLSNTRPLFRGKSTTKEPFLM